MDKGIGTASRSLACSVWLCKEQTK